MPKHPPAIKFSIDDEDGNEVEHELPAKWEVCPRCEGSGSHVNPNIDGHGITANEWNGPDWDDESRETYMNGGYDVTCKECNGARVVAVVDTDLADPALLKVYQEQEEERAQWEAEDRYTRRWENGGRDD